MVGALFFIMVEIPVSAGELLDKLSILQIKKGKIRDVSKLEKVDNELSKLYGLANPYLANDSISVLYEDLIGLNVQIWDAEDKVREHEKQNNFDDAFVSLARSIYYLKDERFNLKNKINVLVNSELQEVKQYTEYK